ncbi:MAG: hypothetical protein WAW79_00040 [Steroidobacteraceae bacterium]
MVHASSSLRRSPRGIWVVLAWLAASAPVDAESPARLVDPRVLAIHKQEIHFYRERTVEHLSTATIPRGWAQSWWLDAADQRLAVLSREGLMKQKGPLQLSFVDLTARQVAASMPLEGTLYFMVRSKTGRFGFLCMKSSEAKKGTPAKFRLVRVDLVSGTIGAERTLADAPGAMAMTDSDRTVAVVFPGASGKTRGDRKPGRVELLSAESLETRASVALPGPGDAAFWSVDHSRLYAEDIGLDDARPEVALPGRLYVIDTIGAKLVADLELGVGPGPLGRDTEHGVFYVLTRPRKAKDAEASLLVIRGDAIEREIGLPARPVAVVPNAERTRFYVLEEKGLTLVDGALTNIEARIPLADTPTGILPIEGANRAFVSFAGSSQVASIDLGTRQILANITTGRAGKKFGLAAAAVLGTALSQAHSLMMTGNQWAMAQVVTYPSPETSGLLSPDGKLAFFYNSQTGDYTVVEVETNLVLDQIAGSGLRFLPGGKLAAVMQLTDVALWDLEARRSLGEIDAGGGGKWLCPDGDHVWAVAGIHSLNVVDLGKRAVVKEFDELGGGLLFYDAAQAAVEVNTAP